VQDWKLCKIMGKIVEIKEIRENNIENTEKYKK
jgi:hypothetical protein